MYEYEQYTKLYLSFMAEFDWIQYTKTLKYINMKSSNAVFFK